MAGWGPVLRALFHPPGLVFRTTNSEEPLGLSFSPHLMRGFFFKGPFPSAESLLQKSPMDEGLRFRAPGFESKRLGDGFGVWSESCECRIEVAAVADFR